MVSQSGGANREGLPLPFLCSVLLLANVNTICRTARKWLPLQRVG